jgi:hypothetical protein
MKFYVPHAEGEEETESVYRAFASFVGAATPTDKTARIRALAWDHDGKDMSCNVGQPMPRYYQTGDEPVLAIFDAGDHFKICTPSRGGVRGEPILAGKRHSQVTFFSE